MTFTKSSGRVPKVQPFHSPESYTHLGWFGSSIVHELLVEDGDDPGERERKGLRFEVHEPSLERMTF